MKTIIRSRKNARWSFFQFPGEANTFASRKKRQTIRKKRRSRRKERWDSVKSKEAFFTSPTFRFVTQRLFSTSLAWIEAARTEDSRKKIKDPLVKRKENIVCFAPERRPKEMRRRCYRNGFHLMSEHTALSRSVFIIRELQVTKRRTSIHQNALQKRIRLRWRVEERRHPVWVMFCSRIRGKFRVFSFTLWTVKYASENMFVR